MVAVMTVNKMVNLKEKEGDFDEYDGDAGVVVVVGVVDVVGE